MQRPTGNNDVQPNKMALSRVHGLLFAAKFRVIVSRGMPYTIQPPVWLGGLEPGMPWDRADEVRRIPGATGMSLAEKLKDADRESVTEAEGPASSVNIGFAYKVSERFRRDLRLEKLRNRQSLEKAARHRELDIPLSEVQEFRVKEFGPFQDKTVAEHYGIYKDLFKGGYFYPVVDFHVGFPFEDELVTPVYQGNIIPASDTSVKPHIHFDSGAQESEEHWTMILTSPDSHLVENEKEYLLWMIGNIPGQDVEHGDVLCDYLQPFPAKGTGFHRQVFILFKQDGKLNLSDEQRPSGCHSLKDRTFSTYDFLVKYQDQLTPAGLRFFLCEWDDSVTHVYHDILNMRQPEFSYAHPPPYHPPLKKYPHREPFDRYYDRYRDKKDIAEEVLRMKMDMISPFSAYKPPRKYPLVHIGYPSSTTKLSWLRRREELMHRRLEQFKDLP